MKKIVSYAKKIYTALVEAVGQYHTHRNKNKTPYL